MLRYLHNNHLIRIPVRQQELFRKIEGILGAAPNLDAVALEHLSQEIGDVEKAVTVTRNALLLSPLSLDALVKIEDGNEDHETNGAWVPLGSLVSSSSEVRPESMLKCALDSILEKAFETLSDDERKVLKLGLGMVDGEMHSAKEIAGILGVEETTIEEIRRGGWKKLRDTEKKKAPTTRIRDTQKN